jgi:hypothetical protein
MNQNNKFSESIKLGLFNHLMLITEECFRIFKFKYIETNQWELSKEENKVNAGYCIN